MLSSKIRVAAVLAGLLLAPALSFAQAPGGGRGGFGGGRGGFGGFGISGLLQMEAVQKEVSITDEQKAELAKLGEAARTAAAAGAGAGGFDREAFEKLSEEERTKRFGEMRAAGAERAKQADEAVKALLKPEQWARLSELRVQQEGVRAWSREDVQKQLGLTEDQVAKIKTLNDANAPTGGFGGGRPGQDQSEEEAAKAQAERTAKRKAYDEGMAAVLTADQTAVWTKMQGAKFEFPARGGRGGQGGGRTGGGTGNARPPAN